VTASALAGTGVVVYRRRGTSARTPVPAAGSVPEVDRTLVVVELGGGNDGLATVVPLGADHGRYRDLRPTLAVDDPIDLDGGIGLHPALGTVAERYRAGTVAVVEGLGTEQPDLSHFVSMRRWWDGTESPDGTGWLGRYLDAAVGFDDVLAGVSIGPGPSPATLGAGSFTVGISDTAGLASGMPWWVDDVRDFVGIWSEFAPADVGVSGLGPLHRAIASAAQAETRLRHDLEPLAGPLGGVLEADEVDIGSLEGQLALAGALVTSSVAPKVVYVHGAVDFDTHENQLDRHSALLAELDRGLARLLGAVEDAGAGERVVVMTTSEFGRRAAENDGGTDHGTAGPQFLIGDAVAGGRYGEPPRLDRLDGDDNLVPTVDFRSLYASVLAGWFDAGPAELLGRDYELLPLFRTSS
jgi:uncharacterized protein (DUF1501 family)